MMPVTRSQRKRKKRIGPAVLAVLLVLLIICAGAYIYIQNRLDYYENFNEALDPGSDIQIEFSVPKGAGTQKIAQLLQDDGIIGDAMTFRIKSRLCGYDGSYQAGSFSLSPSMTMEDIMQRLQKAAAATRRFTIPEGYTLKQVGEKLAETGCVESAEVFYKACEGDFEYSFLDGVQEQYPDPTGSVSARANRLEGFLYPSTYEIYEDASARDIVNTMLKQFDRVFTPLYEEHKNDDIITSNKLSVQDIVTLASLIERETRVDEDRALVSSVAYNRLKKGMRLQMDATVQYALGETKERVLYSDLKIDSPYNTYVVDGLPAAPIASPGEKSIKAAFEPEDTDYIYYVLKPDGSGSHNFAETEAQFQKYKQEYLDSL